MKDTRQNTKDKMLNLIREKVGSIITSDQWKEALAFRNRLPRYSFFNIVLIFAQNPEATIVAGYQKWRKDLNRQVNKGETGIKILAPIIRKETNKSGEEEHKLVGFRTATVFDVSQTSGEPIPAPPTPELLDDTHPLTNELFTRAITHAESLGLNFGYEQLPKNVNGYYRPSTNSIRLAKHLPPLQQLKTLIHELAHAAFEHGTDPNESRNTRELEAETTAYMVLSHFNLDTSAYSFPYLAHYSGDDLTALMEAGEKAHRLAKSITAALEGETLPSTDTSNPIPQQPEAPTTNAPST